MGLIFFNAIISTHALTWSATCQSVVRRHKLAHFNSRAHVERDRKFHIDKTMADDFNSRAHVERDGSEMLAAMLMKNFNSRAHVERDRFQIDFRKSTTHFNSRAHVERDRSSRAIASTVSISTHALTWSATRLPLLFSSA